MSSELYIALNDRVVSRLRPELHHQYRGVCELAGFPVYVFDTSEKHVCFVLTSGIVATVKWNLATQQFDEEISVYSPKDGCETKSPRFIVNFAVALMANGIDNFHHVYDECATETPSCVKNMSEETFNAIMMHVERLAKSAKTTMPEFVDCVNKRPMVANYCSIRAIHEFSKTITQFVANCLKIDINAANI